MSGQYASKTDVPVSRSREELERTIARFGATGFGYAWQFDQVMVQFEIDGLRVRFNLRMPDRAQFRLDSRGKVRTESAIDKDWEQAQRRMWRSLCAVVKAKLIAVEDQISTLEQEFLAFTVLPDGSTVGDQLVPELREIVETGKLPPLMPGLPSPRRVIELGERTS